LAERYIDVYERGIRRFTLRHQSAESQSIPR
jgi:hypothetical protein